MAGMWDWLPGPSGLWDYLSQYPERYRDQILQGLMQYSERGGTPASSGGPLLSALNPLGPFAEDVAAQAAPLVEPLAEHQNRMYEALTGEEGQLRGEHIAGPLIGSVFRGRLPDVGKTGFFSPTSRALAKAQPKATGKQFVAAVKKEPGATAEAKQGGLIELLEKAPGTMTKEQALSMWNPVELTETVRANDSYRDSLLAEAGDKRQAASIRLRHKLEEVTGLVLPEGSGMNTVSEWEQELRNLSGITAFNLGGDSEIQGLLSDIRRYDDQRKNLASVPKTKYGSDENLNLPGGTNAKEILVQMPDNNRQEWEEAVELRKNMDLSDPRYPEVSRRIQELHDIGLEGPYTGGHYEEPNVLAHIRTNERDVGGRKALHIEEIQSDWHQQGQKKGYRQPPLSVDDIEVEVIPRSKAIQESGMPDFFEENLNNWRNEQGFPLEAPVTRYRLKGEEKWAMHFKPGFTREEIIDANAQDEGALGDRIRASKTGIPDAPFKKNWHELAFKRALTEAINDPSIERLTWTTGAVQADRYNLAKYLDSVEARLQGKMYLDDQGATVLDPSDTSERKYRLAIREKNGSTRYLDNIKEDELADYLGKDLAEKVVNEASTEVKLYSGLDLEVGGEFHKNLYDKKITQFAKKFLKKYGVEPQRVSSATEFDEVYGRDGERYYIQPDLVTGEFDIIQGHGDYDEDNHQWMRTFSNYEDAIEGLGDFGNTKDDLWYIDITPEMREEIMTQGVPLTQRRKQMGLMAGYA